MKFKPYGNMVLVQLDFGKEFTTEHGIILEHTIQPQTWGTVVAIGEGAPHKSGKILPFDVKVGDFVYVTFNRARGTYTEGLYSGNEITYHVYDRNDILCAVEMEN
jgi:co-chaperonin GroES (HSP10)